MQTEADYCPFNPKSTVSMKKERATLGGKLSAVLVAAGSAVGLGNIWRFPYVAGENGGGAFLLIYIFCILLLGFPVLLAEFSVGRHTRKNAVGAYRSLSKRWTLLGYNAVLSPFVILGSYFVVAGWTLEYLTVSLTGGITDYTSSAVNTELFELFSLSPVRPIIYTLIFIAVTHTIIVMGVRNGIERSAKLLMPLLFIMLIVLALRSVTLPGGLDGLVFFFKPDFSKVTASTFLNAMGQSFFSLSIGLGCMITYASYFKRDTSLTATTSNVIVLDTLVAVLSSMVIFPAVFSVGIAPEAGPSLVFITLPSIFNTMPLPWLWSSAFFLLLGVAALTSTISLHEVITAYVSEEWHMSRKKAARIITALLALLASAASLSVGIGRDFTIFGMTLFDFLDTLTADILLPIGGLGTAIFAGWFMDRTILREQITNYGSKNVIVYRIAAVLLKYVCPVLLSVIFIYNLGIFDFLIKVFVSLRQ